ncbi:aa3-type cytochrome oxidase subunit II [Gordonia jinhuaensis]|nr:cytochrome c oxidase subunit II [Gordonia jinhuaensis]
MSGCSTSQWVSFGWPTGITPEAHSMRHLWQWSVIAALAMGILVWGLTFWTITFHRRKANQSGSDEFPRQTAYNVPLELFYTAVPFLIIAVLFYFTIIVQNKVEAKKPDPTVVVDVTAFQWNWKFGYRDVTFSDGTNYNGFDRTGGPFEVQSDNEATEEKPLPDAGKSDEIRNYLQFDKIETQGSSSQIPVLVLPTDARIEFQIASADVIHSFWVPEFLFKRDVFPFPKQNHTDNRFQVSQIERPGAFVGRCAEMCGTFHSMMNFEVRAVSRPAFDAYIKFRRDNPEATNAQALEHICQTPVAVSTHPFDSRRGDQIDSYKPDETTSKGSTTLANCSLPVGA